ncbi:GMC family oxidoreductase [Glaciecola punicea]|nr:GMC family oxidoreductase N-terminal domain-containing protein [Glaciecola punicea]OFA31015.1 GMC family oxidoreductase [Glaciecola punicea]
MFNLSAYDYIIVGAGSAGCVLASRLSQDPNITVCLLEAGKKDTHPAIHIPFGIALMSQLPFLNWNYESAPVPHMNNRAMYWPRGKTLGGSSSINAMCYIRGHPENYNDWAKQGAQGWDWSCVMPYFRKSEHNSRGISTYHGGAGPLSVSDLKHVNPVTLDYIESGKLAGTAQNPDFNGLSQEGVGLYQVTQSNGSRCSTAKGYLSDSVKDRPNLTIFTQSDVSSIVIENGAATGVNVLIKNKLSILSANKEVLLCAGAINSPQLLLQSGIGPKEELERVGIKLVLDLPGVGKNLQDHLDGTILFKQKQTKGYGLSFSSIIKNATAPYQYWRHKMGLLTSNIAEGGAFIKSSSEKTVPDIQIHFLPGLLLDHGRTKPFGHGFTFHFCNLYPKSRGSVSLSLKKGKVVVCIEPNYLQNEADIAPMLAGYKWAHKVATTGPLGKDASAYMPNATLQTDEQIIDYIRGNAESIYHPVGTCKMGREDDPSSVVNSALQVKGLTKLRVVDASIMPTIIGGNTNAPTIMIAEKAADMIKAFNARETPC